MRLDGPEAASALVALTECLPQAIIGIWGQIVAETMVELGTADDEGMAMTSCALVFND